MGLDPISIGASALQTGVGIVQGIIGGIKAKRAQKQLEGLQTPRYNESSSIMDYYNKALQRYNLNPNQTQEYQQAIQRGNENQAAGINALQSRGSAVGGIARLNAINNGNALNAGVAAERERDTKFGQLGGAAGMKAGEDMNAFQYNQVAPYEKKYNLLSMKAGAANQTANAGMSNIYGGLGALQDYSMLNREYDLKDRNNDRYTKYLRATAMGG
jgi:hypothetical protein